MSQKNQTAEGNNKKDTNYFQGLYRAQLKQGEKRSAQYLKEARRHVYEQKSKAQQVGKKQYEKQKFIYRKSANQYAQEEEVDLNVPVDGEIERGSRVYTAHCAKCHSLDLSAEYTNKAGPTLGLIYNRKIGSDANFLGYTDGMLNSKSFWNAKNLYYFMSNPKDFMPGTTCSFGDMATNFKGLSSEEDRADILTFLKEYGKELQKNIMIKQIKNKGYDLYQTEAFSGRKEKQQKNKYQKS